MPVRVLVTEGTAADCSQAVELIEGIDAEYLLADKAYDTNAILSYCEEHEVIPAVPPKRNRKHPRAYDVHLYRHRHLVELLAKLPARPVFCLVEADFVVEGLGFGATSWSVVFLQ